MYYLAALAEYPGPEPGSRGMRIRDVPPSQLGMPLHFYSTQPRLSGKRFTMKNGSSSEWPGGVSRRDCLDCGLPVMGSTIP